jgi:hypothetical protein
MYAAAHGHVTSQLEKLLAEQIEIPGVCLLRELPLLNGITFFSHL